MQIIVAGSGGNGWCAAGRRKERGRTAIGDSTADAGSTSAWRGRVGWNFTRTCRRAYLRTGRTGQYAPGFGRLPQPCPILPSRCVCLNFHAAGGRWCRVTNAVMSRSFAMGPRSWRIRSCWPTVSAVDWAS